ncbi:MAG: hypothetical protein FWG49_07675, partial [Leptospirales bacterium]|nr:hypothetical protein [Leptospirales bacterium]
IMAMYDIENEKKDFVGIGKIMMYTKPSIKWNIPHLHFLVYRNYNHFESICLEFGLVSSGEKQEEAAKRLVEQTIFYIGAVMYEGGGFNEFKEIALNDFMNEYWGIYRHIEFCLAETKEDLSYEIENRIKKEIQEANDAKLEELIESMAKDEFKKEYEKMTTFKLDSIEYSSLEATA